MTVSIPQVITEDRASGAQFIDGSLKFDGSKSTRLTKTFASAGNRTSWTWSCWVKRDILTLSNRQVIFGGYSASNDTDWLEVGFDSSSDKVYFTTSSISAQGTPERRDPAGWYHFFSTYDGSNLKIYVNNNLDLNHSFSGNRGISNNTAHYIGQTPGNAVDRHLDGRLTECYFIDGQVLNPSDFAYTDPLTNTWRPKKYTGDFNISSSDYTGVFAPYSAISRWNSFKKYTTVNENSTGHTLPMSNPSHYGGKTLDLASGGFQITTNNSAAGDFFMAVWVNLDSYATGKQMGVNIATNYVYFETQASGAIKIRHIGSGGATSNSGYANGTNQWQHWALSRSGGSLRAFVNGQEIVTDTGGISGNNTVPSNSNFNFFGADNNTTSYNIDGQVIDAVIYIGQGVSGNFTPPTAPLIDASGNINHYSGFSDSQLYFASPLVDVSGSDPNSSTDYITTGDNSFYLPLDGNTPIGKDQSGNGNDWTPVNFGGSVDLPKATGAIPILNTNEAGTVAKPGARTDSKTYTVTASGGNYYLDGALKPTLNAYRGGSYTFDYTGATSHPFYLSSLPDGKHNSKAYSVEFDGTTSSKYLSIDDTADLRLGTGDWTIEEFVYIPAGTSMPAYWVNSLSVGGESNTEAGASIYHTVLDSSTGTSGGVSYIGPSNSYRLYYKVDTRGRWVHIAVTRESGTVRLFVDGTLADSTTDNSDYNATTGSKIGVGSLSQNNYLTGKVSNVRVVKGQALYTSSFTPPSTTLTTTSQGAIASNVKLLCCQDNDPTTATVIPNGSTISNTNSVASVNYSPFLYDINGYYGINTATSNITKITIPHTAADTLYYYCSAHSGMGSSINVTTDIRKADPYAWKCAYALPLLATASDESASLNVNSDTKAITVTGASSSSISNFYSGSFNFSNSNGAQYLTTADSSDFDFGGGEFTIEAFVEGPLASSRTNSVVFNQSVGGATSNSAFYFGCGNDGVSLYLSTNGTSWTNYIEHTQTLGMKGWHHIVWQRRSNNLEIYVDGIRVRTGSFSGVINDSSRVVEIGRQSTSGSNFNGRIQDFRAYKGVAKYTSNFIPGSTNPDILPDTPSGITGKTNLTKVTEGAVALSRSPESHLIVPDSNDLAPGSGDFTIETFMYAKSLDNYPVIWDTRESNAGDTNGFFFGIDSSGLLYMYDQSAVKIGSAGAIGVGRWYHVALVRKNNDIKMYVDGVQKGVTYSRNHNFTNKLKFIGDSPNTENQVWQFNGFYSNWRFTKGQALYDGNFDVPTEPLTATSQGATGSNVKLLACQSPTSVTAATVSPANEPFSGAGGAEGGGTTSDYLQVSSSGHSDFSVDGDFTFEWWHYRAATNVNNGFMWTIGDSKTSTGLELYWGSSGSVLRLYTNNGPNTVTATAATGWHHYAVVRSGNTIKVYYDGTEGGSFTNTNTFSGDVRIGAEYYNSTITGGMNGPMSQFRFVKGTAVYTSNFTAPTTALTAITNTKLLTLQGSTITDASGTSKTITVNGTVTTVGISKNGSPTATNFNPFTDDINAIRGQETGYATWNPLTKGSRVTLSNGNLDVTSTASSGQAATMEVVASIGTKSGKYYVEWTNISNRIPNLGKYTYGGTQLGVYSGGINNSLGGTTSGSGFSFTSEDIIALAVDFDNKIAYVYKNNFLQYTANYTTDVDLFFKDIVNGSGSGGTSNANFGQKPFKFPPPDGFQPLNLSNVQPEKVIARPDQYVSATLFTGTGDAVSSRTVELPHAADLVWAKSRDRTSSNQLLDTVRGDNLVLQSNSTQNDRNPTTQYSGGGISTIDGKTITIASGTTNNANLNTNNEKGVIWSWKAGGSKGTFNIDDVGYANASDVNMNVGALNSSAYDTSDTWSDDLSSPNGAYNNSPITNAFNGSLSNGFESGNPSGNYSTIRFQPATPITVNTQIRIYVFDLNDSNVTYQYRVNDGSWTSMPGTSSPYLRWQDLGFTGTLTSFEYRSNTSSTYKPTLYAVEIDGKRLVDSGTDLSGLTQYPSIAPTGCSVGTKQGFSILMYQGNSTAGASISHGLSEAPKLMIHKSIDSSTSWYTIYNDGTSQMKYFYLNSTHIANNSAVLAPTSNVMHFTASAESNNSGENYIVYMWHDVPGLQKFGTYEGNTTEGAFVELGFRPAIIWIKSMDQTWYWNIQDTKRSPINPSQGNFLRPDQNFVEGTASGNNNIDFLSNGFKIRSTTASSEPTNVNGQTYFYAAWAEAPTVNLYGGHANAR